MKGDIAEQCNIYYVPKRDDIARNFIEEMRGDLGPGAGGKLGSYEKYFRNIQESEKRGEQFYSILPQPGIASAGATIWTFHWTGELMTESAVVAGGLINGVQMDEAGKLRFVVGRSGRTRLINDKPFLAGRGGRFGANETTTPFTGTLICSTPEQNMKILWSNAEIPLEAQPRKPDLGDVRFEIGERRVNGWVEGAEWLYAGASPIVASSCSCPTQRIHLDWYKRVYVPEQYRHSIGVLDDAGNLILHLGRYGNFDSGLGNKSKIRVGGDEISLSAVRFISGTDNYLVFDDGGERLTVLKLNYHAEETTPVAMK
jgi:hypothetical protein